MITVVVPFAILLAIILINKIPYIGGNIQAALLITGFVALLMGGIYNPIDWLLAWIDGIDRIAWVLALAVLGSIYAETQVRTGTMDTVMNLLRSKFGHSARGMAVCIIIALVLAGSLLGDSVAAATVIGVLIIPSLAELGLSAVQISAIILMGAELGSIMPPVTQAVFLSASLVGVEPDSVVNVAYFTVGAAVILVCLYVCFAFIKSNSLPQDLIPKESFGQILKQEWKNLIPLMILIVLIVLRTGFKIDLITMALGPVLTFLSGIKILKGLSNLIVMSILIVTIISFLNPKVYKNAGDVLKTGLKNVKSSVTVSCACGLMLGAFYSAGQIDVVREFALQLDANVLKIGGAVALALLGMLTGSQSTAQNTIFSFFGPALVEIGVTPVHAAIAGSHVAVAGQVMPPACIIAFVVCGLTGGMLNQKVDPVKTMVLSCPMAFYFLIMGIIFMFI